MRLNKTSLNLLPGLLDNIHDRYFWITRIAYNRDNAELQVYLGEKKKGPFNKILRFRRIIKYVADDIAGTDLNSINTLNIDIENNIVSIDCNAPADINIQVCPDFEIVLDEQ